MFFALSRALSMFGPLSMLSDGRKQTWDRFPPLWQNLWLGSEAVRCTGMRLAVVAGHKSSKAAKGGGLHKDPKRGQGKTSLFLQPWPIWHHTNLDTLLELEYLEILQLFPESCSGQIAGPGKRARCDSGTATWTCAAMCSGYILIRGNFTIMEPEISVPCDLNWLCTHSAYGTAPVAALCRVLTRAWSTYLDPGTIQSDAVQRNNFLFNAVTASHIPETCADCYLRFCCIDGAANAVDELHGNIRDDNQRNIDQQSKKQRYPSGSLLALVGGQRANCQFFLNDALLWTFDWELPGPMCCGRHARTIYIYIDIYIYTYIYI